MHDKQIPNFKIKTGSVLPNFLIATGSNVAQNITVGRVFSLDTKHSIYLHSGGRKEETMYVNSQNIVQRNVGKICFGE